MEKIEEVGRNRGIYKGGGKLVPIYAYIRPCLPIRPWSYIPINTVLYFGFCIDFTKRGIKAYEYPNIDIQILDY